MTMSTVGADAGRASCSAAWVRYRPSVTSSGAVPGDQQDAGRAGEAGQLAHVGRGGHEQGVDRRPSAAAPRPRSRSRRPATSRGAGRRPRRAHRVPVGRRAAAGRRPRRPGGSRGRRSRRCSPSATGATTEVWRNGSRAAGLERCSSTTTPSKAARASCSDHEVWVRAPALTMMAAARPRARVDRLDQLALVVGLVVLEVEPEPAAASVAAATWSARVAVRRPPAGARRAG